MHAAARPIAEFVRMADLLPDRDQGSADRTVRAALIAILAARHLDHPVDLLRVLEMIVVRALNVRLSELKPRLDPDNGLHLFAVLLELDNAGTSEARLVHALETLDNRGTLPTADGFLRALRDALTAQARERRIG